MVPAVHVGMNLLSQLLQGWVDWKVVRNEGTVQSGGRWETELGLHGCAGVCGQAGRQLWAS